MAVGFARARFALVTWLGNDKSAVGFRQAGVKSYDTLPPTMTTLFGVGVTSVEKVQVAIIAVVTVEAVGTQSALTTRHGNVEHRARLRASARTSRPRASAKRVSSTPDDHRISKLAPTPTPSTGV